MLAKLFSRFFVAFFFVVKLGTPCSFGMQPPDNLIPQDLDRAYFLIKRTFQTMIDTKNLDPAFFREDNGTVDLFNCKLGREFLGNETEITQDIFIEELSDIALQVVLIKWNLTQLGYPSQLWLPNLKIFEKNVMNKVSSARIDGGYLNFSESEMRSQVLKKIVPVLNQYRIKKARHLPPVESEGGCGAGEIGINISTTPQNGRVWLIPTFYYELCRLNNIDPFDMNKCTRWREHIKGLLFDVAGDYRYQAIWPDGFIKKGTLTFTNVEYGQTIVISQDRYQNRGKKTHGIDRNR